jgi:hypothetical protein
MGTANTKYEKLFAVYEDLITAIADIRDPVISSLCSSWKSSKSAYEQALKAGVRKSQIASGLEQGLRELPMLLREVENGKRAQVSKILHSSVARNFPEFFRQDASLLAAIIERSKIRNAREYYAVRHRIDELEGDTGTLDECNLLYKLVDQFDS